MANYTMDNCWRAEEALQGPVEDHPKEMQRPKDLEDVAADFNIWTYMVEEEKIARRK